jgi:SAM-dependent methyltransferase
MKAEHGEELARRDRAYWWFRARYATVERMFRRHATVPLGGLLDFGCGSGGFLQHAVERGLVATTGAIGVDGDAAAVARVRGMGFEAHEADSSRLEQVLLSRQPSAVAALDVLEHLDEPVEALRSLRSLAASDATIVVLVPAMPSLWSEWDDRLGHRRRYTPRTLRSDLEAGGWQVRKVRSLFFSMLAPAWLRGVAGISASQDEFPSVSRWIDAALGLWTTLENRFPWWPAGTSLAAVAERR